MSGAPVFDHPQPPGGDLVLHTLIQQDDRVRDVFFDAVPGQRPLAPLPGDDGSDAEFFKIAEQAAQFGAQQHLVGQPPEQGLHRVQDHPFGPHAVNGVLYSDEEAFQIVLAGFFDLAALDKDKIQGQRPGLFQGRQVKPQGSRIFGQLPGGIPRRK